MSNINDIKKLKTKIESIRALMNHLWNQRGYTDKDVLAVSIELDRLMNQYQQLITQGQNQQLNISCSPNSMSL